MTEIIIGIDLGTTNSEVAYVKNGKAVLIEDAGEKILPSVVGISEQEEILVGNPAKNQYIAHPERTIKAIKRLMGKEKKVEVAGKN